MFKISVGRFYVVLELAPQISSRPHTSLVSQFTLLASTKKGSKPDFHGAVGGEQARVLYQRFVSQVQQGYEPEKVKDGVFQAMMVSNLCRVAKLTDIRLRRLHS